MVFDGVFKVWSATFFALSVLIVNNKGAVKYPHILVSDLEETKCYLNQLMKGLRRVYRLRLR